MTCNLQKSASSRKHLKRSNIYFNSEHATGSPLQHILRRLSDVVSTLAALLELLLTNLTTLIRTQSHKTGYTTPCLRLQAAYLSASDVVSALTALLELPLKPGDEATPRDRFWCAT